MPIRDLGYRPYEGKRLPPSHATSVIFRHGLRRIWSSWLVKLATFFAWIPMVVVLALAAINLYASESNPLLEAPKATAVVFTLAQAQLWFFVTLIALGGGATTIAEDLTFKTLQIYFSKPLTPRQYLIGRTAAVSLWAWLVTLLPCVIAVVALTATAEEALRFETAGVLLPALLYATLIAGTCAIVSVGVSSLGRSRALTMTGWVIVFLVPHMLAILVEAIGDWSWLRLLSLPAMLGIVGEALFRLDPLTDVRWYHALMGLGALSLVAIVLANRRLRDTSVVP